MNKIGGFTLFISLMLGILFFVIGLAIAPALNDTINQARLDPSINCTNSSISNQNKAICTQMDIMPPVFIGVIFGLAGMLIGRIVLI